MSEFLESAPNNWQYSLIVASVPKDGTHFRDSFSLNINEPVNYWSQVYTFINPLKVDVEVERTEGRLAASISVSGETIMPCSRCLEPAKVEINGSLKYFFSLRPSQYLKKEESNVLPDGDEFLILIDSWKKDIDLVPLIWEVLITSLQATGFCFKQCKGLCPKCGINLNKSSCDCKKEDGDPRFEVLRSFIKENK